VIIFVIVDVAIIDIANIIAIVAVVVHVVIGIVIAIDANASHSSIHHSFFSLRAPVLTPVEVVPGNRVTARAEK
jgi:hypothetical protein